MVDLSKMLYAKKCLKISNVVCIEVSANLFILKHYSFRFYLFIKALYFEKTTKPYDPNYHY